MRESHRRSSFLQIGKVSADLKRAKRAWLGEVRAKPEWDRSSDALAMLLEVRFGICTLQVDNESISRRHWEDPAGWEPQIRHLLPLPLPSASGMVLPGDAVRLDLDNPRCNVVST